MAEVDTITVTGFKSIASIEKLQLGAINVVIGPNGSGKSNFIEVFAFLHAIREGHLHDYVIRAGGADKLLHFGSKTTPRLILDIALRDGETQYAITLLPTNADELLPLSETVFYWDTRVVPATYTKTERIFRIDNEAGISDLNSSDSSAFDYVRQRLDSWRLYHFHDTSSSSPMKKTADVNDNRYLRPDGSNLAAFLYLLKQKHGTSFGRRTNLVDAPVENKAMSRLLIHVEGQTEETFVNDILAPHLYNCGYTKVSPRLMGNARQRDHRRGIRPWNTVRMDIIHHLKEDSGCIATTMVDYYGLPQTGGQAWPGRAQADTLPFSDKAETVENALLQDISTLGGSSFNPNRFIPYVMMHEFEGLLFSDCRRFGQGIGRPDLTDHFQAIRDLFVTPEEINDSYLTAPSKRVEAVVPEYEKPLLGVLAALEIGLDIIRAECPHFRKWIEKLEQVPHS